MLTKVSYYMVDFSEIQNCATLKLHYTMCRVLTDIVYGSISASKEEKTGGHVVATDRLHVLELPVLLNRLPHSHLPSVANGNQLHTNEE